ncbi:MAG: DMT family transporter [Paracoccaceae bacterium]
MDDSPLSTNKIAILLMISAIFCFSIMDAFVKVISPEMGILNALWARYSGQMIVVLILVAPRLRSVAKTQFLGLQIARSFLLLGATFFLFLGLARIGLAQATAVMVMNPVFITLGGAIFLGETLGYRRLSAIAVAFVGAMLIIRPGTQTFDPAALFPLIGALSYSGYALITRQVGPREDPWTSLFYTALVGGVLMTLLAPFYWVWPDPTHAVGMLGIAGIGTLGQLLLIKAFSQASAGTLAPFGYSGLLFATLIGITAFQEFPDLLTTLGALVIVLSGIYVWRRETTQTI